MQSIVTITILLLFLTGGVFAETSQDQQAAAEKRKRVQAWKEQLKKIKDGRNLADFEGIQMALAKEGESEQLQQLICELDFGIPVVQHNALRKLRYVGGWFAISAVSRFLGPNPKYMQHTSDKYGSYVSLQLRTLRLLPHIAPNPPLGEVNPIVEDHSKAIKTWDTWLQQNRKSLMQLQPIGHGIVSSWPVCKDVLRHDPESTKYTQNR